MSDYLGVSRRDVGAGLTAAASAFLGGVLSILWSFVRGFRPQGSPVLFLAILVTPVVALFVTSVVWRVAMPDEPTPVYGALAGALAAAVSISIFTAFVGIVASVTEGSAVTLGGSVSEAISFATSFVVYGGLFTFPFVVPIGASVGYGYEWYVARGQQ